MEGRITSALHLGGAPVIDQRELQRLVQIPNRILMTADCVGGVWNYSLDLAEALAQYGVHVGLATMGPPPSQSQRAQAGRVNNLQLFESNYRLEWMESPWAEVDAAGLWLMEVAK